MERKPKRKDSLQVAPEKKLVWFSRAVVLSCSAILIFRLVASLFPEERLWGINHLAYFSTTFGIAITLLGLIFLVPSINRGFVDGADRILNFVSRFTFERRKYLWFAILSVASIVLFVALGNRTHFLGDGTWLVTLTTAENPQIGWSEPLEYLVHILMFRFVGQFASITGFQAYEMVSYLAGVLFVFFAFLAADTLGENRTRKAFVFLIITTMGGMQLFFGYAEHYALSYVFILAFILFSVKYLSGKTSLWVPGLFLVLSVFSHMSSLQLLPAFVFLYLYQGRNSKYRDNRTRLRKYGIVIAAFLAIAGFSWYIIKSIGSTGFLRSPWSIFIPLTQAKPDAPGYTLFSIGHLLDVFNEHMLLSPVGAVLLLTLLFFIAKKKILKDGVVRFLLVVSIFQVTYSLVLDPILGAAVDWDLFSASALGYTVLALYLFSRLIKNNRVVSFTASILVVTSLLSTAPWVMLNADVDKSVIRTRVLTDLDPKRSKGPRCALLNYFELQGMKEEASKEVTRMMEGIPEIAFYNLGLDYISIGNPDSAIVFLKKAVGIEESFAEAHYELGRCYVSIGEMEPAVTEYRKALASNPKNKVAAQCHAALGDIHFEKREFEKAAQMYEKAIKIIMERIEIAYCNLGYCYLVAGKLDEAISMCQRALESKPGFMEPHIYLGQIYHQKGNKEKAAEEYEVYLEYSRDEKMKQRVKELLSQLNQE